MPGRDSALIDGVVAIDGPTAAGKTTISRLISSIFDIQYLESGRAYRLLAFEALRVGIALDDAQSLAGLCDAMLENEVYASLLSTSDDEVPFLRTSAVTRAVSPVASVPAVRTKLSTLTRLWAASTRGCVIEGRDIGTVVFPDAAVKIFLTASPEIRARRRQKDEVGRPYDEVLRDLTRRDEIDSSRSHSPLTPASDAVIIDSSALSIDEVLEKVVTLCGVAGFVRRPEIRTRDPRYGRPTGE